MRLRAIGRAVVEPWDGPEGLRVCVTAGHGLASWMALAGLSTVTSTPACDPKAASKRRDMSLLEVFSPFF